MFLPPPVTSEPIIIMEIVRDNSCERLEWILTVYEMTPWKTVARYITYLTGTAIVLTVLGLGALAAPKRLAPRVLLGALLFALVMALTPYFILDGRRDEMVLMKYKIENFSKLNAEVTKCNTKKGYEITVNSNSALYQFKPSSVWWESHVMIIGTCVAGMLMSRILYLSATGRANDNESNRNRLLIHLPRPQQFSRPNRNIDSMLVSLRASPESREKWRDTQCAICLDDLVDADVSVLKCNHSYHEKCLGSWLRSSNARGKCPMCKASVWKDEPVSMNVHRRRPNGHTETRDESEASANTTVGSQRYDSNSGDNNV